MQQIVNEWLDHVNGSDMISSNDFRVLYYLCRKPESLNIKRYIYISSKDIKNQTGISKPTVRRCINNLEMEGLIRIHDKSKGRKTKISISIIEKLNRYYLGEIDLKTLRNNSPKGMKTLYGIDEMENNSVDSKWKDLSVSPQNDRFKWKEIFHFDKTVIKGIAETLFVKWKNMSVYPSKMENSERLKHAKWKVSFDFVSFNKPMKIKDLEQKYTKHRAEIANLLKKYPPIYTIFYIRFIILIDYYVFEGGLCKMLLDLASKAEKLTNDSGSLKTEKGFRIRKDNIDEIPSELANIDGFVEIYNKWLELQEVSKGKPVAKVSRIVELEQIAKFSSPLAAVHKAVVGEWNNVWNIETNEAVRLQKNNDNSGGVIADV